jgi:hypothetical protein
MAITGNGSTGFARTTSSIAALSLANLTVHCWYRNTAAPGTAAIQRPFGVVSATNAYYFAFSWDHTTPGRTQAIVADEAGGTSRVAQLTSPLLADTWYAIGGSYDGTNIKAWLSGSAEATTACAALGTIEDPSPSIVSSKGGTNDFDDGTIAEFAVWNAALSADEMAILAKKVSPLLVRPGSLVVYWPLIRSFTPWRGGPITSGGTTTVAVHPPMIYPAGPTIVTEYIPIVQASFSSGMGLASSTSRDFVEAGLSNTALLKSRFRSSSGYLSTGRATPRTRER